jgi:hypothetical protein
MTFETWVDRVEHHETSPVLRAVLLDWAEDRNVLLREILRLHDALQTAWWALRTDPGTDP